MLGSGTSVSDSEEDLPSTEKSKQAKEGSNAVPLVFSAFIIIRALDRVFLYRVQKTMAPYASTLMSVYWPPMVQFMCFLVCLGYVVHQRITTGDKQYGLGWFSPWNPMASAQGPVPPSWLMQFSFWDQLNAMVSAPSSPFIPLVLQTPLNNTVVIWTAFIAYFYLKTRFKAVHYIGIALIIFSCLSGVVVELQGPPDVVCDGLRTANASLFDLGASSNITAQVSEASTDCIKGLPPYKDANGNIIYIPLATLGLMYVLYLVAVLPTAFVNCYKQKKLKQVNLDIMWSFFWSGMWQVIWGVALFPLEWVPWPKPGGHNTKSPATLMTDLADSWTCFTGTNPNPEVTTCSAEPAWLWFAAYLLFNVFFNLMFLWLIKRLSGTWASIGSILCGNLCGVFSQFKLFAGDSAAWLTMEQWNALALSSIAMAVYNVEEEVDVNGKTVYGEKESGDHRYDAHGALGIDPDSEFTSDEEPDAMSHGIL